VKIYYLITFTVLFSTTVFSQEVYLIKIDGSINPSTADYIHKAINEANEKKAECLIIELNTPGGLLKSTRYIVSDLLTSPVPVVVFVSPSGAQAASAGVFIVLASTVAVMSPGTNIGASHPVGGQGQQMDSVMNEKITNDAAAFIRSISEKRKRNVKWSEDAVRRSVSITENEALDSNVIDLIATDLTDLLNKIDGREVETTAGSKVLNTKNARVINYKQGWFQDILSVIADPNIAYILLMIGIWGIILEFYNPVGILPGVVGVICIILGLYGIHTLPINYAGVALIILGIILFILEIKITSYGLLTISGLISLFFGSMMLIDPSSPLETAIDISMNVIITTVVIITLLFVLLALLVIKAHKRKAMTGESGMIGAEAEVIKDILNGKGSVKLMGEIWDAVSDDNIVKGEKVVVTSVNNLTLTVKKSK
jgi:membrane-bound serine protease (ClpP class)